MRLTNHVILNVNNKMSTTAVFLDIEKPLVLYCAVLFYKLSTLKFSSNLMKLISSYISQQKFCVGRRRNIYANGYTSRGATRFCPAPTLFTLYINDTPQKIDVNLVLFAYGTCLYAKDSKESYLQEISSEG
jgi:hypothetical protein